ncbi:nucleotidyltransferase family protein [Kosmotoga pacifica]|uniref:MobA-like NTP transferase domain-containing protein n=1 Tax=Kosmotoga pacifica TaxID=1330330 RepID=A0A0G2Z562_9BACT|nr:nucleotidyltransferase family protein [Kosmotoga pacifica]AKI96692.1 hypothetical protein IX53_01370 [Kosmotoga pacifica]
MNKGNIGIVVLSAGESSRFGSEKLLFSIKGKPLIAYVLDEFRDSKFEPRFFVVKPGFPLDKIDSYNYVVLINDDFKSGLSASLRLAIKEAVKEGLDGVFILLGDMPFLKKADLETLSRSISQKRDCIITFRYRKKKGFPTYIPAKYFNDVLSLTGDRGVGQLIESGTACTYFLDGEWRHSFDIDSSEDVEEAQKYLEKH